MPRGRPRKNKKTSLEEFLNNYDNISLIAALENLKLNSQAWDLFVEYIRLRQREFEIAALDLMGHTGKEKEAAKASGYALALEDVINRLIPELQDILRGKTGVVENPMPEEVIENN